MKRLAWILLAVAVPAISSCATGRNMQPRVETFVEVDNQALADMTVYIMRGSQRVRLGLATGLRRSRFTVPGGIVFGATTLRFYADPVGGRASPVSEEVVVTEGEVVVLRIPPR